MNDCGNCECEIDSNYVDDNFYIDLPRNGCPKCECSKVTSVGNTETHPDNWTQWNCNKCGHLIAEVDNSPIGYCWEFEDNTF